MLLCFLNRGKATILQKFTSLLSHEPLMRAQMAVEMFVHNSGKPATS